MIKQLKDYITISDIISNGNKIITSRFSTLDDTYNDYLKQFLNTNNDTLSLEYLSNRLDKILSPLYSRLIDHYDGNIATANEKIIKIIENKFLFNWNKLATGFFADYNPIHNYDMSEHEEVDNDRKVNSDVTSSTETSDTQKYAGFNSGSTLPVASESEGESETTTTGELASNEQVEDNERTLTRAGNIGVTTTAQMLTQEFELRKRTLLDKIYEDMDTILFVDYYL